MNQNSLQRFQIILLMYLGYAAMMIGRQMVTILSPALLTDKELGFTVKDTGDILAFGTIGAMAGKAIWGPLADKIGGRLTFLAGISLTGLLITAFGMSYQVIAFTLFAALSYATKSSGWPAMTKIIANWISPEHYGRTWSIISTSSRVSVVVGTLFFGWLLAHFHWRTVAFLSTGLAMIVYAICYLALKERPSGSHALAANDTENNTDSPGHPLAGTNLREGLIAFAKSQRFWWVVIMLMSLTCAMAFLDFIPAYLLQVYELSPSKASMASSVMPLGSLIGLVLSIFFYDRISRKHLRFVLGSMLLTATLVILTLQYLPYWQQSAGFSNEVTFPITLALIVIFGIMTSPAYYIPMSIFSIEFGGPHSATLIALIDMLSFAASASFGFAAGRLAEKGWDQFMWLLIAIALIAMVSTIVFMHLEYRAALRE